MKPFGICNDSSQIVGVVATYSPYVGPCLIETKAFRKRRIKSNFNHYKKKVYKALLALDRFFYKLASYQINLY